MASQSSQIAGEDVRPQFDETRNRIFSIASIHELLYRSTSFAETDPVASARQPISDLVRLYGLGDRVRTEFSRKNALIELERAPPYGLLVNELVSNALKHAFPGTRSGSIRIDVEHNAAEIQLLVSDDGIKYQVSSVGRRRDLLERV